MLKMHQNYCPICYEKNQVYNPQLILNNSLLHECPQCHAQIVNLSPFRVHLLHEIGTQDFLIPSPPNDINLDDLPIALVFDWSPFEINQYANNKKALIEWVKIKTKPEQEKLVNYKSLIEETQTTLWRFGDDIHEKIVNIIMFGELSDWSESVKDRNEAFCFDNTLIESIDDINVVNLYALLEKIQVANDQLVNLNPYLTDKFKDDEE
jgi:hypothetical protein